jgi:hypothetical protein
MGLNKGEGVGQKLIKRPRGLGGLMGLEHLLNASVRQSEDGGRLCSRQVRIAEISGYTD